MNNRVHPQEVQLPIDEMRSPLELDFSESELFQNNPEVGSINDEDESFYDPANLSIITIDDVKNNNYENCLQPPMFDIDLTSSFSLPQYINNNNNNSEEVLFNDNIVGGGVSHPEFYKEDSVGFLSYDVRLTMSGYPPLLHHTNFNNHHPLEFEADNNNIINFQQTFNFSMPHLQALSGESQHLLHGSPSTTLASDISSLEDPNFKVAKLSPEERKRKILRYLKKRNERNFSKKIKYACRKTLADSRPRVRGRFAKNDELAEMARTAYGSNLGDDTDEDVGFFTNPNIPHHQHKVVQGEEVLKSDIFAHISEVNSFKSNYPIQSWI